MMPEVGKPRVGTRGPGWIATFTGEAFYPLDPRPEEIHKEDIRHALWNVGRFTGHTRRFYSVGEHSAKVVNLALFLAGEQRMPVRGLILAALYHDASEAYLADIATPVKMSPQFEGYRQAEKHLQAMIDANLWEHWLTESARKNARDLVKLADMVALVIEAQLLVGIRDPEKHWGLKLPEGVDLDGCFNIFVKTSRADCRAIWENQL